MSWLPRILAPVDFSPRSHGALQYAEALARHFHGELTLLHVVPPPIPLYAPPLAMAYGTSREAMESRLEEEFELEDCLASQCPDVPVVRAVMHGNSAQSILDYARDHDASLIVMATHGYRPFRRFLLGSVTAEVLHDAACPVWTGPRLEDAPGFERIAFRRVLCAIDLAKGSRAVLAWAGQFAREFAAELSVVHVLPKYYSPGEHATEDARQQIACLLHQVGVEGEVFVEMGDIPVAVSDVAALTKADLLVIGRGNESGLAGRMRANAYAVVCDSPCPVTTI